MHQQGYKTWVNSPYFSFLNEDGNKARAAGFVARLFKKLKPPPASKILDAACGEGFCANAFANLGCDVTGLDLGENTIETAKLSADENPEFYQHDLRYTFTINYFDYVLNLSGSFGMFENLRQNITAFGTMANALKPGGTLVFSFLNMDYVSNILIPYSRVLKGNIRFDIDRWQDNDFIYKNIYVFDGNKNQSSEYRQKIMKFTKEDLDKLCCYFNLQITGTYGYLLQKFDEQLSPTLIIFAKKIAVNE